MLKKLYFLIGLFVISILIMIASTLVGLNKLSGLADVLNLRGNESVQMTDASFTGSEMYEIVADSIINRDLAKSAKDWKEGKDEAERQWARIEHIVDTDKERQLFSAAKQAYVEFVTIYETEMLPLLQAAAGNVAGISAADAKLDVKVTALAENLSKVKESLDNDAHEAHANMESATHMIIYVLLIIGVCILVVVGLIGLSIVRNVVRQLGGDPKDVAALVAKVAEGQLNNEIILEQGDTDSLLANLKIMQDAINNFVSAQGAMAKKHAEGWIKEQIDASQFPGTYGKMAKEINELVASHVAVKMQVVEVVGQYAKGDFSRDMDRLPGDKAKVTAAIDSVKTALLAISNEIKIIVDAGVNGDFSKRSDADRFEFMFNDILTGLNNLIETCDVGFNDVLRVAIALAQGDLTQAITRDYPGLFGQTKDGINDTVENLKGLVGEIQEAADTISTAAKEIAAGNNDLSHRTEEQAASLEETAASMEELTSTVQANSENAKHASQLAVGASDIAGKGVDVIGQVVSTMEGINDSSRKVEDIIAVIDGIAFQTNILALNAAVEAARAGEQGRGFAVVAVEVRNLAQRATAAASEIKGLIGDSVEKVNDGTKLVAKAGLTMKEIVGAIRGVTGIMSEISAASVEQTSGIEQVNQAIGQMDDVTQQNAALVEQAAAAAESLEEQTQSLSVTVSHFNLGSSLRSPVSSFNTKPVSSFSQTSKKSVPVKVESYKNTPVSNEGGMDLDKALAKHAEWKNKFRASIKKHEAMDAKTISRDDCCDFGKWLYGDAKSQLGHLASFSDCVSKHADFHIEAGKIAAMINAQKFNEAQAMLTKSESAFISASTAVGVAIMSLKKESNSPTRKAVAKPKLQSKPAASDEWEEF
jgi:methyl-accepting chemotaxis protein